MFYNEDNQAIIIDPGCYAKYEKQALKVLLKANIYRLTTLINTHCHLDHVFGNKYVYETYNLELHLHPNRRTVIKVCTAIRRKMGAAF